MVSIGVDVPGTPTKAAVSPQDDTLLLPPLVVNICKISLLCRLAVCEPERRKGVRALAFLLTHAIRICLLSTAAFVSPAPPSAPIDLKLIASNYFVLAELAAYLRNSHCRDNLTSRGFGRLPTASFPFHRNRRCRDTI